MNLSKSSCWLYSKCCWGKLAGSCILLFFLIKEEEEEKTHVVPRNQPSPLSSLPSIYQVFMNCQRHLIQISLFRVMGWLHCSKGTLWSLLEWRNEIRKTKISSNLQQALPLCMGFRLPRHWKDSDILKLLNADEDFSTCCRFQPHCGDSFFDSKPNVTTTCTCLLCVIISVITGSLQSTDYLLVCFSAENSFFVFF